MATPIILADNLFLKGALAASWTASGYDVLHLRDGRPYTYWMAPSAGTSYLMVSCGAATPADCLGLIGHNLGSASALVSLERSTDGSAWTEVVAPFRPSSDRALLKRFTVRHGAYWRLKIVTASVVPYLAVTVLGRRLEFPFPPNSPYAPYSASVVEDSSTSKTGNALGTVVRYVTVDVTPVFSNIDRKWVEDAYRPFWSSFARLRKYFFWAWDLDAYPDQVFYLKDVGRFDPTVSVLAYYESLKLQMQGVMEP